MLSKNHQERTSASTSEKINSFFHKKSVQIQMSSEELEAISEYVIVEFPEESHDGQISMALISSKWIFENNKNVYCYWPAYLKSTTQREKSIQNHLDIRKEKFTICPIRIKYGYDNYTNAQEKLKALEDEESSNSDGSLLTVKSKDTRQRAVTRLSDYDYSLASDEEDYIPEPPKLKPNKMWSNQSKAAPSKAYTPLLPVSSQRNNMSPIEELNELRAETSSKECSCDKNIKILKHLIKDMIILKKNVQHLVLICEKQNVKNIAEFEIQTCHTYEELKNINDELKNEDYFKKCCQQLGLIGGKDCGETTRRILSRLIGNDLAIEINFTGKNQKNGLKPLDNVLSLIKAAIRRNHLSEKSTDIEINNVIMTWLRNAPDREGVE